MRSKPVPSIVDAAVVLPPEEPDAACILCGRCTDPVHCCPDRGRDPYALVKAGNELVGELLCLRLIPPSTLLSPDALHPLPPPPPKNKKKHRKRQRQQRSVTAANRGRADVSDSESSGGDSSEDSDEAAVATPTDAMRLLLRRLLEQGAAVEYVPGWLPPTAAAAPTAASASTASPGRALRSARRAPPPPGRPGDARRARSHSTFLSRRPSATRPKLPPPAVDDDADGAATITRPSAAGLVHHAAGTPASVSLGQQQQPGEAASSSSASASCGAMSRVPACVYVHDGCLRCSPGTYETLKGITDAQPPPQQPATATTHSSPHALSPPPPAGGRRRRSSSSRSPAGSGSGSGSGRSPHGRDGVALRMDGTVARQRVWHGAAAVLRCAQRSKCHHCRARGASVPCDGCSRLFHLPCAVERSCMLTPGGFGVRCRQCVARHGPSTAWFAIAPAAPLAPPTPTPTTAAAAATECATDTTTAAAAAAAAPASSPGAAAAAACSPGTAQKRGRPLSSTRSGGDSAGGSSSSSSGGTPFWGHFSSVYEPAWQGNRYCVQPKEEAAAQEGSSSSNPLRVRLRLVRKRRTPTSSSRGSTGGGGGSTSSATAKRKKKPKQRRKPGRKPKAPKRVKAEPRAPPMVRDRKDYMLTQRPSGAAADVVDLNDDWCAVCGDAGDLLCCDGPCHGAFHLRCVGLRSLPVEDEWLCHRCTSTPPTPSSGAPPAADAAATAAAAAANSTTTDTFTATFPAAKPKAAGKRDQPNRQPPTGKQKRKPSTNKRRQSASHSSTGTGTAAAASQRGRSSVTARGSAAAAAAAVDARSHRRSPRTMLTFLDTEALDLHPLVAAPRPTAAATTAAADSAHSAATAVPAAPSRISASADTATATATPKASVAVVPAIPSTDAPVVAASPAVVASTAAVGADVPCGPACLSALTLCALRGGSMSQPSLSGDHHFGLAHLHLKRRAMAGRGSPSASGPSGNNSSPVPAPSQLPLQPQQPQQPPSPSQQCRASARTLVTVRMMLESDFPQQALRMVLSLAQHHRQWMPKPLLRTLFSHHLLDAPSRGAALAVQRALLSLGTIAAQHRVRRALLSTTTTTATATAAVGAHVATPSTTAAGTVTLPDPSLWCGTNSGAHDSAAQEPSDSLLADLVTLPTLRRMLRVLATAAASPVAASSAATTTTTPLALGSSGSDSSSSSSSEGEAEAEADVLWNHVHALQLVVCLARTDTAWHLLHCDGEHCSSAHGAPLCMRRTQLFSMVHRHSNPSRERNQLTLALLSTWRACCWAVGHTPARPMPPFTAEQRSMARVTSTLCVQLLYLLTTVTAVALPGMSSVRAHCGEAGCRSPVALPCPRVDQQQLMQVFDFVVASFTAHERDMLLLALPEGLFTHALRRLLLGGC